MALRFQQHFTLFPGVRLNVGKNGISASIGVAGATINLGQHGVRSTVGLPGSGLSVSNFQSWEGGKVTSGVPAPIPTSPSPAPNIMRPIASAAVETLTSASMVEVQTLLRKARDQAREIKRRLNDTTSSARNVETELNKRSKSIFRFFYKKKIAALSEKLPDLKDQIAELKTWEASAKVDINFESSDEANRLYGELVRAFGSLRNASKIWDITAEGHIDRVKERSAAVRSLDRSSANLFMASSPYIKYVQNALVFENKNGEDIYIYPGIAIMERRNDNAFALIDLRDLDFLYNTVTFIEEDGVPGDSKVVSHAWKKSNKDGSPDRRFRDNYQIPVCQYGQLLVRSKSGVREEYQFSTTQPAQVFAETFAQYKTALATSQSEPIQKLSITPKEPILEEGSSDVHFNFVFRCKACGSNTITLPDDRNDDGDVTCSGCGYRFGTYGEIVSVATKIGLQAVADGTLVATPRAQP